MTDYAAYPRPVLEQNRRKRRLLWETILGAAVYLLLLTLMGWSVIEWPAQETTPTLIHADTLKLYTAQHLAEETARLNQLYEQRARK